MSTKTELWAIVEEANGPDRAPPSAAEFRAMREAVDVADDARGRGCADRLTSPAKKPG